jgi:hypothetical protein
VARALRQYQISLHDEWCVETQARLPSLLKRNIIRHANPEDAGGSVIPRASVRFDVNYDNNLRRLVSEARYLDTLQMDVPEMAVNVTLQVSRVSHSSHTQTNKQTNPNTNHHPSLPRTGVQERRVD